MDPFSREPGLKESLATFLKALYGLAEIRSTGRDPFISVEKESSPEVTVIMELGSLIKDWTILREELIERNGYCIELLTDKKSREKVLVCLQKTCAGKYRIVFFIPVPTGKDLTETLEEALIRISPDEVRQAKPCLTA